MIFQFHRTEPNRWIFEIMLMRDVMHNAN